MPIPDEVAKLTDWLPLKRYLDLYGETDAAVRGRIVAGAWQAGVHYSRPKGAGIWVSIKAVNEWAAAHVPERVGFGSVAR